MAPHAKFTRIATKSQLSIYRKMQSNHTINYMKKKKTHFQ